ncbi:dihydroorotase, multifunctional complex type [Chlorobaculum parvum NCIB 8327]|uniref:Dihydroorotase n=1 Tax=Chlorobaculum parvum (strain DSM 263 / NCIMB 8327) TaxID=517417 RepID=B3QN80_CHLP8|nr:dihydroorotase [Chlorobaculum parvum]ACF11383.1 dihydroorotase, multifunctional complex type [Chlorobaculum parvum NCIB 8327]
MSTLFLNARLLNPAEDLDTTGSIKIDDQGIIEAVATGAETIAAGDGDLIIDLEGKVLAPGLFDMHCHFREPGQEYKETLESGSAAAVAGGFTGVALMPNTKPVIDSPLGVAYIRHHSAELPIDIEVIGAMTVGSLGEALAPYGKYSSYGVKAISDDGTAIQNTQIMRLAVEYTANFDLLLIQHAEDKYLTAGGIMNDGAASAMLGLKGIPEVAEPIMIGRDLQLITWLKKHKLSGALPEPRYHVAHISTAASVDLVRKAKAAGLKASCEVTPHHFTLTENDLVAAKEKGNYIMKPPLPSEENRDALIEGLRDGTIEAIATDHAPHARHEKECPPDQAAFGIIGLETSLGLTITELVDKGVITLSRAIELLSTNPRRIMGLEEILFKPGKKANFAIIDPDLEWTVSDDEFGSKSRNTPFLGRKLKGKALGIYNKAKLIMR